MTSGENRYRFESNTGYDSVSLLSGLNDAQWGQIENAGTEVIDLLKQTANKAFVVDLTSLNQMGSAMVALIIRLWKAANSDGEQMVVINNNDMVKEVLVLAGLDKVWTIVGSREQAAEKLLGATSTSSGGGTVLLALLVLANVAAAGAGLYLAFNPIDTVQPELTKALLMGGSAAGCFVALILAFKAAGTFRYVGIVAIIASIGIAITGAMKLDMIGGNLVGDDNTNFEQLETG